MLLLLAVAAIESGAERSEEAESLAGRLGRVDFGAGEGKGEEADEVEDRKRNMVWADSLCVAQSSRDVSVLLLARRQLRYRGTTGRQSHSDRTSYHYETVSLESSEEAANGVGLAR